MPEGALFDSAVGLLLCTSTTRKIRDQLKFVAFVLFECMSDTQLKSGSCLWAAAMTMSFLKCTQQSLHTALESALPAAALDGSHQSSCAAVKLAII